MRRGRRGRRHVPRGRPRLSDIRPGRRARIVSVEGGRGMRERMNGMGLFMGTEVTVEQAQGDEGMMVIGIGSGRLMVCGRMARRIVVEEV